MARARKRWHYREILEGMYLDQGLNLREIASVLGTTAATILYWMKKHNIERRDFSIGEFRSGTKVSDAQKKRLSEISTERFKDKRNHPMYGRIHSAESRQKMSEAKKRLYQQKHDQEKAND